QIDALYGPFTELLPNSQYIDYENPFIRYDFQQEIEGYECPWGNVQLAFIYNQEKVPSPPVDLKALAQWTQAHPGKFTLPTEFTGMTVLKSWLYALAGGGEVLRGDFDEKKYEKYSAQLWEYINQNKKNWWKKGETFPNTLAQMHQLFANGELYFTMSNNDSEVDNKIQQGLFPVTSRAFVPAGGSIQNSHYLGIVGHSAHKAAALVTINLLISPEAQLEKMKPNVWGDGTVLAFQKLPENWQKSFANIPGRNYAPSRQDIQARALMEPAPEYMIRLYEDFRKKVIER
ncbi:MAG: ABC transporter substrate-binding protein, partial [Bacteroidota bacterium]